MKRSSASVRSERDLSLLRSIFLDAVGSQPPDISASGAAPVPVAKTTIAEVAGAPTLSTDQLSFLEFAESSGTSFADLTKRVDNMKPEALVECAAVCAEMLHHANLTDAHSKLRTWKGILREDTLGVPQHEGAALPTFQSAFDKLEKTGVSKDRIRAALASQKVDLVLTAHPTEARRRTILLKQKRIVELLEDYEHVSAAGTPGELQHLTNQLKRELLSEWRTSSVRRSKPTAEGEARNGMAVVEDTLWRAVPEHYRRIDRLLQANGLAPLPPDAAPIQISSWMGGDRDGNPNVTSAVTRRVVTLLRSRAAEMYYKEVDTLLFELTHSGPVSAEMAELVAACKAGAADKPKSVDSGSSKVFTDAGPRFGVAKHFQTGVPEDEPYRVVLMSVRRRLYKTKQVMDLLYMGEISPADAASDSDVYNSTADLLAPLMVMHRSLVAVGDAILADEGTLLDLIRRINTFGLALTRLDCRQESERHAEALDAVTTYLGLGSYLEWPEEQRCAWIESELASKRPLLPADLPCKPAVREVLDTFATIAELPCECMGAYVISMSHYASDVLAVRLLQKASGVKPHMRVAPLFETREDLQAAPTVMKRVLASKAYDHGGKHEVMLGCKRKRPMTSHVHALCICACDPQRALFPSAQAPSCTPATDRARALALVPPFRLGLLQGRWQARVAVGAAHGAGGAAGHRKGRGRRNQLLSWPRRLHRPRRRAAAPGAALAAGGLHRRRLPCHGAGRADLRLLRLARRRGAHAAELRRLGA